MIESLEERAASARQSIGNATDPVPGRDFDPPRQNVATLAAVVFVAVLAAGGIWAIARGDGPQAADVAADGPDAVSATEEEPTVAEEPAETPEETPEPVGVPGPVEPGAFLVFENPPDGLEPMIFTQPQVDSTELPTFDVYGTTGETPFADRDLLVASITVPPDENLVDPGTPTVEVDGQTIFLEEDEGFSVVSWFRGEEGTGLLSHSYTQDELVTLMTGLIQTGELNTDGLTLIEEDAALSFSRFGGEGTVIYQASISEPVFGSTPVSVIVVNSLPTDSGRLLMEWFQLSEMEDGQDSIEPRTETIEHNGWTIQTGPSVEGGLDLRFEIDGVPVQVTLLDATGAERPSLDDALAILGNIRGATEAEIDAMTIRGEEMMGS